MGRHYQSNGYDVEILINNQGKEQFLKQLLAAAEKALFVCFTVTTAEVQDAIRLAKALRLRFGSKLPLAWGGWHSTLFPEQMRDSDLVDFAVVGEGERCLVDIANNYRNNDTSISIEKIEFL